MKNQVLVVGSVAFDSIENAHGRAERVLGGAASYSSISASYFARPSVVAVVGTDFTANYRTPFKKRGVDISGLQVKVNAEQDLVSAEGFGDVSQLQSFQCSVLPKRVRELRALRQCRRFRSCPERGARESFSRLCKRSACR